jgi:hypothetical protein
MELVTRTTKARRPRLAGTKPKGRICTNPHCNTPLSIYNFKSICNACWLKGLPVEEREAA